MVLALTLITNLLLAMTVSATPFLEDGLAPRGGGHPLQSTKRSDGPVSRQNPGDNTEDDSNADDAVYAAGAFLNGTFNQVTATITVGKAYIPPMGAGTYYATAWVGAVAEGCGDSTIQTGIAYVVNTTTLSYFAWYAVFPGDPTLLNITVNTGDQIRLTSIVAGNTTGTSMVENISTGEKVVQSSNSTDPLCPSEAAWVLEEYKQLNSTGWFAEIRDLVFADAAASNGFTTVGPGGATLYDIHIMTKPVTTTSIDNNSVLIGNVWELQ